VQDEKCGPVSGATLLESGWGSGIICGSCTVVIATVSMPRAVKALGGIAPTVLSAASEADDHCLDCTAQCGVEKPL
jgi:hypothetical protein